MDAAVVIKRSPSVALFFAVCFIIRAEGSSRSHAHQQKHLDGFHSSCSRCPPGFGVVHRCTLSVDTVCHSCSPGYYASGYSRTRPCLPCSRCGEGLFEAHSCTATKDTVCDACINHRAHVGNQDYDRKCNTVSTEQNNSRINDTTTLPSITAADNPNNDTLEGSSDDVAAGVAQLAAFQIVLIFTAVSAILALSCRLRICAPETTRLKTLDKDAEDRVALVEETNEENP